ncbi:hypothetical protein PsorP6_008170 [Peronosclerospora sorghi]|uniref:Uncharacterized protein n=1 Tax=Peronosclerospora sorghi TaxID=230839 RepID=A0ACC0W8C2_9STRA|nr:hypothetical protein PsorP6_008170 [Peronosclerospora sorghi]
MRTQIGDGFVLLRDQSVVFLKLLEGRGGGCGHIFDEHLDYQPFIYDFLNHRASPRLRRVYSNIFKVNCIQVSTCKLNAVSDRLELALTAQREANVQAHVFKRSRYLILQRAGI